MIKIIELDSVHFNNKICNNCKKRYKKDGSVKLLKIGTLSHKLCKACLKEIHNQIHQKCDLPLMHTSIKL